MKNIGKRIKQIRELHNVSANKLSKSIGVDPSTISKIENGNANPSIELLDSICNYFNISLGDFFISTGSPIIPDELNELLVNARRLSKEQLLKLTEFIKSIN